MQTSEKHSERDTEGGMAMAATQRETSFASGRGHLVHVALCDRRRQLLLGDVQQLALAQVQLALKLGLLFGKLGQPAPRLHLAELLRAFAFVEQADAFLQARQVAPQLHELAELDRMACQQQYIWDTVVFLS